MLMAESFTIRGLRWRLLRREAAEALLATSDGARHVVGFGAATSCRVSEANKGRVMYHVVEASPVSSTGWREPRTTCARRAAGRLPTPSGGPGPRPTAAPWGRPASCCGSSGWVGDAFVAMIRACSNRLVDLDPIPSRPVAASADVLVERAAEH